MANELGLRSLRSGFARSAVLDRAFALGWPELRVVDGTLGIPEPDADARWCWSTPDALAHVRTRLATAKLSVGEAGAAAGEALALARHLVHFGWNRGLGDAPTTLFLIEGLLSAGVLAEAMISALEETTRTEWSRAHGAAMLPFYLLGLILLRTEASVADRLRQRLATVFARRSDERGPLTAAVDLVLHGAAGARRSAPRFGPTDRDLDPAFALLIDDDPELLTAVVRGERFVRYDRRYAARLAWLGDDATLAAVVAGWYAVGSAAEQGFFLATVGHLAGDVLVAPTLEAARSSRVKAAALAWLESRGVDAPAPLPAPGAATQEVLHWCEGDEYGFVLLAAETAVRLRGEEDHTVLAAGADPDSPDAIAAEVHGGKAVFFCLSNRVALRETQDGALVAPAGNEPEAAVNAELDAAASRRWLPVTSIELPTGRLVGLSAAATLTGARDASQALEITLPAGRYDVRRATCDAEDDGDAEDLLPLIWLRRVATTAARAVPPPLRTP